jgi:CheY-like chemotaxis protein
VRVLVIDDDIAFLGMVRAALEEDGHMVVTATDGGSGLVSAARHSPDAIILDVRMPVADGTWFARAYERQPGRHAPIIVISSHNTAYAPPISNAVAHLMKPFELDELRGLLERLRMSAQPS